MMTKVLSVEIPEYKVDKKPDYMAIGPKVDTLIGENLEDGHYIERTLSVAEHPGKTLDELASIILQLGTDKYDPNRKESGWKGFSGYDHHFHAAPFEIIDGKLPEEEEEEGEPPSMYGNIVYHFYEHIPLDRQVVLRADIVMIYYASQMQRAEWVDQSKREVGHLAQYLYKFKDSSRKQDALAALVKIL